MEMRSDFEETEEAETADDESDEEEEDEEGDEESESEGDEEGEPEGEEDEEGEEKPKKKKKPPAKPKPAPKPRARAAKHVRMKIVWGVFNNSNSQVETYPFSQEREARAHAEKLSTDKKQTHFVQKVKKPLEEKEKEK
jgi:hypothetical protein